MKSLAKNPLAALVFCCLLFFSSYGAGNLMSMNHDHAFMENDQHNHEHQVHSEFDFLAEMIPHHQEAVDSSKKIKAITDRPELRDFAGEIIKTQKEEIRKMEEWLELWYPDRDVQPIYQPMMRDLEELPVEEAEKTFLEDMILHHEMAVIMAASLLEHELVEHQEVEVLARSITEAQEEEIEMMQKWLDEWF